MPAIIAKAFTAPTSAQSGFSISLNVSRGHQYIRLGMTAAAQERVFGRLLDVEKDAIQVILSDEPKDNHIMSLKVIAPDHAEAVPLLKSMRDSVGVKLSPWSQVPKGRLKASSLPILIHGQGDCVALKIPEWSRPPLKKIGQGKSIMDQ